MVDPAIVSSRVGQLRDDILQENLADFDTYVGYVLDYAEGATSNSLSS